MNIVVLATVAGLLAGGLGTLLGGVITLILGCVNEKWLSVVLGFSAGVMISVVCFDLMPEAIDAGEIGLGLVGLVLGSAALALIDLYIPHSHSTSEERNSKFLRVGLLLAIGMTMHSVPEGMAIGSAYAVDKVHGLRLAILIAIQKTPEGMAVCTPILLGGLKRLKSLIYTVGAGLPVGIGALLGVLVGGISPVGLSLSLGFAAGSMLFITFDSLIPDAQNLALGHSATFSTVAGVILGILISSFMA